MHGTSLTALLKRSRARTNDAVILAALNVLEELFHRVASHQLSLSCEACAARYRGNKERALKAKEFKHRAKRAKQGKASLALIALVTVV
jgi:hypothetical protein